MTYTNHQPQLDNVQSPQEIVQLAVELSEEQFSRGQIKESLLASRLVQDNIDKISEKKALLKSQA